MKKKWKWLDESFVKAANNECLAVHGGIMGVRDEKLLESALARPINAFAYNQEVDVFTLAASYAFSIIGSHPFLDGNKRTGFMAAYVFLQINGWDLVADEIEAFAAVIALTRKDINEEMFTKWLTNNSTKIKKTRK